jgi:hypothetical protein
LNRSPVSGVVKDVLAFPHSLVGAKERRSQGRLEGIQWHTFRHTLAPRLTRAGADLVTVEELVGPPRLRCPCATRYQQGVESERSQATQST